MASRGEATQDKEKISTRPSATLGMISNCLKISLGLAQQRQAGQGGVRHGKTRNKFLMAGLGSAGRGRARRGMARQGYKFLVTGQYLS